MTSEQRSAFAIALMVNFITPFMTSAMNLSVSDISIDFNSGATTVTWVVTVYTLATGVFSVPLGHLSDIWGRRPMIIVGMAIFGAGSLACALAVNVYMLIAIRLAMGAASGLAIGASVPLMLTRFDARKQVGLLSLVVTSVSVGAAIGPFVGGLITDAMGWRGIFIPAIVISFVTVGLCLAFIKPDKDRNSAPANDWTGSVLLVVGLTALLLGLNEWVAFRWGKLLALAGLLVLVAFVAYELRQDHPVVQVRLFGKSPIYSLSNLATLLSFASIYVIIYLMAIYLQNVDGYSSSLAGLIMIAQPLAMAVFAPLAGKIAKRFETSAVAGFGMTITAVGLVVLAWLKPGFPLSIILFSFIAVGAGSAIFQPTNSSAVLSCVDKDHFSEASSLTAAMRGIGQALTLVVVSVIFELTIGNVVFAQADPAELANSVAIAMVIGTVAALVSSVLSFVCSWLTKRSDKA